MALPTPGPAGKATAVRPADGAADSNAGPIPVTAAALHDAESPAATVDGTTPRTVVVSSDATARAGSTAGAKPVSAAARTSEAARPVDTGVKSPVTVAVRPAATAAEATGPGEADSSAATIPVRGAASPAVVAREIVVVSNVPRTPENVADSNAAASPVTGAMRPAAASARVKSPVLVLDSIEVSRVAVSAVAATIPATGAMPAVASPVDAEGSDAVVPPTRTATRGVASRASGVVMTRMIGVARARTGKPMRAAVARIETTGHRTATRRRTVVVAAKAPAPVAGVRSIGVRRGRKNPTCPTTFRPPISTRPFGVTYSAWTRAMPRPSRAIS